MESNEISMFMDVKLDINDKRPEAIKFKSWTKCLVKIEAIKCFPCFLRITFIRNVEDESANLSVSINIPGITISLATSRTKQHSYGVFWVHNRKRCFIYFALDTEDSCKRHMKWIKKSIKNMELHRQLFMETRRSSRGRLEGNSHLKSTTHDDSEDHLNPQDILGPLPQIPENDSANWSRRISGFSGIYEEIPDNDPRSSRRVSRVSVASGIYEEMRPILKNIKDNPSISEAQSNSTPPPLPRKRVNTYEPKAMSIPRSNTNPETELAKKKKYKNVIENIFGRSKRSESVSEGKVCTAEDLISNQNCSTPEEDKSVQEEFYDTPMRRRERVFGSARKICNKRNSFSSPDLSKINVFDEFEPLDDLSSLSSELQGCDLSDSPHNDTLDSTKSSDDLNNISEQIQPNFNFSCNSSTINLVGSNFHTGQMPTKILIDDTSGYCAMAPIKKPDDVSGYCAMAPIKKPNSQVPSRNKNNDSDKENDEKLSSSVGENPKDDSAIYENMTDLLNEKRSAQVNQNIYENVNELGQPNVFLMGGNNDEPPEEYYKTPRKLITSIDDKVPSYYPNSCDTMKTRRRSPSKGNEKTSPGQVARHISRHENLYISSPQKIVDQRKKISKQEKSNDSVKKSPLLARKVSENVYTVMRLDSETKAPGQSNNKSKLIEISIDSSNSLAALQNLDFKFDDTKNERDLKSNCKNSENSTRIYQKYATITRISPNKYLDKCAKKTAPISGIEIGSVKKFASLPRFKKIDFSPLKLKINNVLQRHHHDEV